MTPKNGITGLFLLNGVHDENGECIFIEFPLKIVGQNRDAVKIKAGLWILGKEEKTDNGLKYSKDVYLSDCTVTGAKGNGIFAGTSVKCPGETSERRLLLLVPCRLRLPSTHSLFPRHALTASLPIPTCLLSTTVTLLRYLLLNHDATARILFTSAKINLTL